MTFKINTLHTPSVFVVKTFEVEGKEEGRRTCTVRLRFPRRGTEQSQRRRRSRKPQATDDIG